MLVLQARQELLCSELKSSGAVLFPDLLRSVAADSESGAKYSYTGMTLHECIAKAWASVLNSSGREGCPPGEKEESVVLLQGVEVRRVVCA